MGHKMFDCTMTLCLFAPVVAMLARVGEAFAGLPELRPLDLALPLQPLCQERHHVKKIPLRLEGPPTDAVEVAPHGSDGAMLVLQPGSLLGVIPPAARRWQDSARGPLSQSFNPFVPYPWQHH